MQKQIISIFFLTMFVVFITGPTIITIIDDTIDVSVFYDSSSEEEDKSNEKNKDVEKVFFEGLYSETIFSCFNPENELEYMFKTYSNPHLNLILPPPEGSIF